MCFYSGFARGEVLGFGSYASVRASAGGEMKARSEGHCARNGGARVSANAVASESSAQCGVHALSSHALYQRCIYHLCVPLLRGLSVFVVVVVVVVCPLLFVLSSSPYTTPTGYGPVVRSRVPVVCGPVHAIS